MERTFESYVARSDKNWTGFKTDAANANALETALCSNAISTTMALRNGDIAVLTRHADEVAAELIARGWARQ